RIRLQTGSSRARFSTEIERVDMAGHPFFAALIAGEEIERKLQKAILSLPDKQRLVFNLKYFEDLSYDEISKITDTSIGSLKASYHHAVKKLENELRSE
ncbi:sigma-70 family RNA polymerase sigma factor, partial [Cecembia sp.]|uniref:RNA polymerase sigma factor n=1 Tax=Cecembia sp. TaxID=1898110 RepID=UPI0025BF6A78